MQSTSNFAKIDYITPRLFGIQIGASFTPETVRSPLPFTGNPSNDPNQQQNIWEVAASYTGYVSNFALGLSAGFAHGSLRDRTPGSDSLYDWALGAQLAYDAVGSETVRRRGVSRQQRLSAFRRFRRWPMAAPTPPISPRTAEWNKWIAGVEYSLAEVSGPVDYDIRGYQISGGYRLNDNLQITAGWQRYDYRRNLGTFYNWLAGIDMNAGFLSPSVTNCEGSELRCRRPPQAGRQRDGERFSH